MPDCVEKAEDKEEALTKYLLAHEIAHFYFRKIFTEQENYNMDLITSNPFGTLLFVRGEDGLDYPSDKIGLFYLDLLGGTEI